MAGQALARHSVLRRLMTLGERLPPAWGAV
jgi:hypothetical protein